MKLLQIGNYYINFDEMKAFHNFMKEREKWFFDNVYIKN